MNGWGRRGLAIVGLIAVLALSQGGARAARAAGRAKDAVAAEHWVGTWMAAAMSSTGMDAPRNSSNIFTNQTIRMIVRTSIGGERLRVRFSNAFGAAPLTIGAAHVALRAQGAGIVPGSDRALTFSGQSSLVVPPGAPVLSDPVDLSAPPLTEVAISLYVAGENGPATWHQLGMQTTYISGAGNFTASAEFPVQRTTRSWYWLTGVEVEASADAGAVVTLGDSITDGAASTPDTNRRWPDLLAERLDAQKNVPALAVLNAGISGNRLLHDTTGPNALARLERDVFAQDGVKEVIVLEGINDIGFPYMKGVPAGQAVSAADLIAALRQIVERAHAHGIRVLGGTLTPYEGSFYDSAKGEEQREEVNHWIRSSGVFDGVVDFAAAVRDPQHPRRFLPAYDGGDHLHPGDAGDRAMAEAVNLSSLR